MGILRLGSDVVVLEPASLREAVVTVLRGALGTHERGRMQ
jgi:hypothetical protein